MSKCIIIINKPFESRPSTVRQDWVPDRKLWPRCTFNSNDQCILFTTPGNGEKRSQPVNYHIRYGSRCICTPIVLIETRIYTQVAAYLQILHSIMIIHRSWL